MGAVETLQFLLDSLLQTELRCPDICSVYVMLYALCSKYREL